MTMIEMNEALLQDFDSAKEHIVVPNILWVNIDIT